MKDIEWNKVITGKNTKKIKDHTPKNQHSIETYVVRLPYINLLF